MKVLSFSQPHHPDKLHDELLAAVPTLQPVGEGDEREAVMIVSGDGSTLTLGVPDGVDEAEVRAVVEAHDPAPPPAPPDPDAELAAAIEAATDVEELKAALLGLARPGRVRARGV